MQKRSFEHFCIHLTISVSRLTKPKRKTRTSAAAVKKWQSTHVKRYGFPVMIDTEADIIAKLDSVQNKSGYIKSLIRADMEKDK